MSVSGSLNNGVQYCFCNHICAIIMLYFLHIYTSTSLIVCRIPVWCITLLESNCCSSYSYLYPHPCLKHLFNPNNVSISRFTSTLILHYYDNDSIKQHILFEYSEFTIFQLRRGVWWYLGFRSILWTCIQRILHMGLIWAFYSSSTHCLLLFTVSYTYIIGLFYINWSIHGSM